MCLSHFLHKGGGGGQTFLTHGGGTNIFKYKGGQTFSVGFGSGNDDFNCYEEKDVREANILARILRIPEGPEILVYDNCHFLALFFSIKGSSKKVLRLTTLVGGH